MNHFVLGANVRGTALGITLSRKVKSSATGEATGGIVQLQQIQKAEGFFPVHSQQDFCPCLRC